MNNLCPICGEIYDFSQFGGMRDELYYCSTDKLYMCPRASMPDVYRGNYYLHYLLYSRTPFSETLNKARWQFVVNEAQSHPKILLDFGCGAGAFEKYPLNGVKVYSYDPYFNPSLSFTLASKIDVITFWDSLEHMRRIDLIPLLGAEHLVMSLPILEDVEKVISWRHFRPDEHVWCFTEIALIRLMSKFGYELKAKSDFEIKLGRHDIWSYVFKRKENSPG